jgi:flagellar protein FliS
MKQEDIAAFNRRIAGSNRTGLIVVLFDIYFAYEKDALQALDENDQNAYVKAVRQCGQVMEHLKNALDFTYPIAKELYPLYTFVERTMAKAMYRKNKQDFLDARKVVEPLADAFSQIAATDNSEPLMENAQEVTVGLTYGRTSLQEAYDQKETSRGFWV